MKLIIKSLVLYAFIGSLFYSCGKGNEVTTSESSEKANLVVGTTPNYPPYESMDLTGKIVGFDIDVAKQIADRLNRNLVIKELDFDALILGLKQGQVDMIMSGLSITAERKKNLHLVAYQGSPITSLTVFFTAEVDAPEVFTSIEQLQKFTGDKIISLQVGSFVEELVENYPKFNRRILAGMPEQILDLQYKKSFAALLENHSAKEVEEKLPNLKKAIVFLKESEKVLGMGIGLNKDNLELIQKVGDVVTSLKNDQVINELEAKWMKGQQ